MIIKQQVIIKLRVIKLFAIIILRVKHLKWGVIIILINLGIKYVFKVKLIIKVLNKEFKEHIMKLFIKELYLHLRVFINIQVFKEYKVIIRVILLLKVMPWWELLL